MAKKKKTEINEQKEYPILFKNVSKKSVQVINEQGSIVLTLVPGRQVELIVTDVMNIYAPYSQVSYDDKGVQLKQRSGWKEPERGKFVCEFLNEIGAPSESVILGSGEHVFMPLGIPVRVSLDPGEPLAMFKKYGRKMVVEKEIFKGGFFRRVKKPGIVREERPKSELKEIQRIIEERKVEKARADAEKVRKERGLPKD
jgi:hypothetical protein